MIENCSDEVIALILPTIYAKSKFSRVSKYFNRLFSEECGLYAEHIRNMHEACQEIEPEYNSDFEPVLSEKEDYEYEYGDFGGDDDDY